MQRAVICFHGIPHVFQPDAVRLHVLFGGAGQRPPEGAGGGRGVRERKAPHVIPQHGLDRNGPRRPGGQGGDRLHGVIEQVAEAHAQVLRVDPLFGDGPAEGDRRVLRRRGGGLHVQQGIRDGVPGRIPWQRPADLPRQIREIALRPGVIPLLQQGVHGDGMIADIVPEAPQGLVRVLLRLGAEKLLVQPPQDIVLRIDEPEHPEHEIQNGQKDQDGRRDVQRVIPRFAQAELLVIARQLEQEQRKREPPRDLAQRPCHRVHVAAVCAQRRQADARGQDQVEHAFVQDADREKGRDKRPQRVDRGVIQAQHRKAAPEARPPEQHRRGENRDQGGKEREQLERRRRLRQQQAPGDADAHAHGGDQNGTRRSRARDLAEHDPQQQIKAQQGRKLLQRIQRAHHGAHPLRRKRIYA